MCKRDHGKRMQILNSVHKESDFGHWVNSRTMFRGHSVFARSAIS